MLFIVVRFCYLQIVFVCCFKFNILLFVLLLLFSDIVLLCPNKLFASWFRISGLRRRESPTEKVRPSHTRPGEHLRTPPSYARHHLFSVLHHDQSGVSAVQNSPNSEDLQLQIGPKDGGSATHPPTFSPTYTLHPTPNPTPYPNGVGSRVHSTTQTPSSLRAVTTGPTLLPPRLKNR